MSKSIKWRIVENERYFIVKKKVFNLFWLSPFDWDEFFDSDDESPLKDGYLWLTLAIVPLILVILKILLVFNFWKYLIIVDSLVTLLLYLSNPVGYETYTEAENYIKNRIKKSSGGYITDITYEDGKVTIEK